MKSLLIGNVVVLLASMVLSASGQIPDACDVYCSAYTESGEAGPTMASDRMKEAKAGLNRFAQLNPGHRDKAKDVAKCLNKVRIELKSKFPPDYLAAVGSIEGAMGDLESIYSELDASGKQAFKSEILTLVWRGALVLAAEQLCGTKNHWEQVRRVSWETSGELVEASMYWAAAHQYWSSSRFKDAVAQLKSVLDKTEDVFGGLSEPPVCENPPSPVTVTGAVTVQNKVYDGTRSATITSRSLVGVRPGETVFLSGGTATFDNKDVGPGKTVTVTGLALTGTHADNYQLASNVLFTVADITPANLDVVADNKTRLFGTPNPPLTASYIGFVGGETLDTSGLTGAPALATTAEIDSPPGTYPITVANGTLASLNYAISDFISGTLTVTNSSVPPNRQPVANSDIYAATSGVPLIVAAPGVLGNDTDEDGQTLSAILVSGPGGGTLSLNSDGGFTYTAAADHTGPDGFSYRATDGLTNSLTATVLINVTGATDWFSEHFTRADEPGTLAPWIPHSGLWTISRGLIRGGVNALSSYGQAYMPTNWTDYSVEARIQFPDNAYGGGISGRVEPSTGARYAAWIYPENSPGGAKVLTLVKFQSWDTFGFSNVVAQPMAQVSLPAVGTSWHTLKLALQGSWIGVHYDGQRVLSVLDTEPQPLVAGGIGLEFWTEAVGWQPQFDDVIVRPPLPPSASDDVFSLAAGATFRVAAPGVLANDTAEAGAMTALLAANPASGSLVLSSNGGFEYTPAISSGTVEFTYQVSDGFGTSAVATVSLTVTPNTPPIAEADSYNALSGVPLVIAAPGVLANDSDPEGETLSAVLVEAPAEGILVFSDTGGFTYTATNGYVGPDSFTYRARDGSGSLSSVATVSIEVSELESPFADDFSRPTEPGELSPWVAHSGNWAVTGGELHGSASALSSYGCAYVPGSWTDFILEARIRFPEGGYGGGLGGRLDPLTGAHYGVWVYPETSAGGTASLKLVKFNTWDSFSYNGTIGGAMSEVVVPPLGTNWHGLTLSLSGSRLVVSLDGVQYINMEDAEPAGYLAGGITAEMWTAGTPYRMLIDDVQGTLASVVEFAPALAILEISHDNGVVTVSFEGSPSTQYLLQETKTLTPPVVWSNLSTNLSAADGTWTYSEPAGSQPMRFYRSVRLESFASGQRSEVGSNSRQVLQSRRTR